MYLSPQVSDDEGAYFSYPVSPAIRQTNIRTCLPGGFSGSGPEYSMYRSNCLDLMAEECHSKWGPECVAYHSELNKGEQEVFSQLIDRRNAPSAGASSCVRGGNPIVPGQTVRYGMVPMIQGNDCRDNIVMPQSCAYSRPESVIEDSSEEDRERQEDLLRERERHGAYEQQQARRKKEHFQSEFIQQQMYHNEQARRKEHFQSEMIQRGLYESRPMREKFQAQFMAQSAGVPVRSSQPEPKPAPQPEPVPQPFMPSEPAPQPEPKPQPFMPSEPAHAVSIPVHAETFHQAPSQPIHAESFHQASSEPIHSQPIHAQEPIHQASSQPIHAQEPAYYVPPNAVSIPVHLSEESKLDSTPAYVFGVPTDCEQQACSISNLLD